MPCSGRDPLLSAGCGLRPSGTVSRTLVLDADCLLKCARDRLAVDVAAARDLVDRAAALLRLHTDADATAGSASAPPGGGLAPWQASRIVAHVRSNVASAITLAELAELARLSPSQLSRAFKKTFGETPHTYIVGMRLQVARDLMLSTSEPLSQIASACGLADQAHLTRLFRKEFGETPHAWRRARRRAPEAAA